MNRRILYNSYSVLFFSKMATIMTEPFSKSLLVNAAHLQTYKDRQVNNVSEQNSFCNNKFNNGTTL